MKLNYTYTSVRKGKYPVALLRSQHYQAKSASNVKNKTQSQKVCELNLNVIDLSATAPLFSKEGMGEILQSVIKIPLYPPLRKGELEGKFLNSTTLSSILDRKP